jgi:hypothetical protein
MKLYYISFINIIFYIVIQLHMLMKHPVLCPLLFPLLFPLFSNILSSEFWEECKGKCLEHLNQYDRLPKEFFQNNIRATSKYAFGILNGDVWKIDLKKMISNIHSLFKNFNESNDGNPDENVDNHFKIDKETYKTYNHLYTLFNPYADTINALIQEVGDRKVKNKLESIQNLTKWEVESSIQRLKVQVFKKFDDSSEWNLICTKTDVLGVAPISLYGIKLFNDDIIILTQKGPFIYHLNESNESISLIYFLFMGSFVKPDDYKIAFSKPTLPLLNYDSFRYNIDWAPYIKDNKESLLRYGVELLTFAIKEHKLELIVDIYKNCIKYFKEDITNNRMFLSIITSTMSLLNENYPEYISRYSLETTMILDSATYKLEYNKNPHLSSFQYLQIVNESRSIWWTEYNKLMSQLYNKHKIMYWLLYIIQILIILPLLPIYFAIFYILSKYNYICDIGDIYDGFSYLYFFVFNFFSTKDKSVPTLHFMIPYINFVNYPRDYSWFFELIKPQPSLFAITINRDLYKTWSGEALINFKWDTYGKYYYVIIWIGFMALLGCFTAAATIPQQYIDEDDRKQLLIASIIFGFIHLSFEFRQIIYDANRWIRDFWNIFGTYIVYFNHLIYFKKQKKNVKYTN